MSKFWRQRQGLLLILVLFCVVAFIWIWSAQGQRGPKTAQAAEFQVIVYPEKYSSTIFSSPGIRLQAVSENPVTKVRYAAVQGLMLTWDAETGQTIVGKIEQNISAVEVPYEVPVYWSPLEIRSMLYPGEEDIIITITLLDEQDGQIAQRQLQITNDHGFYGVKPAEGVTYIYPSGKSYKQT